MISQLQVHILTRQGVVALERFRLSPHDRLRVHIENAISESLVVSIGKPDRAWRHIWRSNSLLGFGTFPDVASLLREMMDALIAVRPHGTIDPTICARALRIALHGTNPLPPKAPLDPFYDTLAVERDGTRIVWDNIYEGVDGEYNSEDPEDENLLSFSISRRDGSRWESVDDSSYCTNIPASTEPGALIALLTQMMNRVAGEALIKRICEEMSWSGPDDAARALGRDPGAIVESMAETPVATADASASLAYHAVFIFCTWCSLRDTADDEKAAHRIANRHEREDPKCKGCTILIADSNEAATYAAIRNRLAADLDAEKTSVAG